MSVSPIPPGYHTVTPYIIVKGAAAALDYYKKAFGAVELFRMPGPNGCIMHSEFKIGDCILMMADEMPEREIKGPTSLGGTPFGLCLYVPDSDAVFAAAVAAGGTSMYPVKNQFYGDRSGTVIDPFGHKWTIATHIEDVSPEEMGKRAEAAMKEFCTETAKA